MRRHGVGRLRDALRVAVGLGAIGLGSVATVSAQAITGTQIVSGPLEIPKGRAKAGFEIARLNTENYGSFDPFYVTDTQLLSGALKAGKVAADTRVLVTETAAGSLALVTDQMAHHHLAQGRERGKDWMATF